MSEEKLSLDAAREQAGTARAEFRIAAHETAAWLSPSRLKAEAAQAASEKVNEAKAAIRRSVSDHPVIAWTGLAATASGLAYILQRPVVALVRTGMDAVRNLRHYFSGRT